MRKKLKSIKNQISHISLRSPILHAWVFRLHALRFGSPEMCADRSAARLGSAGLSLSISISNSILDNVRIPEDLAASYVARHDTLDGTLRFDPHLLEQLTSDRRIKDDLATRPP